MPYQNHKNRNKFSQTGPDPVSLPFFRVLPDNKYNIRFATVLGGDGKINSSAHSWEGYSKIANGKFSTVAGRYRDAIAYRFSGGTSRDFGPVLETLSVVGEPVVGLAYNAVEGVAFMGYLVVKALDVITGKKQSTSPSDGDGSNQNFQKLNSTITGSKVDVQGKGLGVGEISGARSSSFVDSRAYDEIHKSF